MGDGSKSPPVSRSITIAFQVQVKVRLLSLSLFLGLSNYLNWIEELRGKVQSNSDQCIYCFEIFKFSLSN